MLQKLDTTGVGRVRLYIFLLGLLLSFSSYATSGWSEYGYVVELVPTIHHRFKVNIELKGNKSGCREKQWFYQDYDVSGAKEMYLALLESLTADKKVRVYVTGRCNIDEYAEVSSVGIRR